MKCPFKLSKAPYDGGAECDPECKWFAFCDVLAAEQRPVYVAYMNGACREDELVRVRKKLEERLDGEVIVVDGRILGIDTLVPSAALKLTLAHLPGGEVE